MAICTSGIYRIISVDMQKVQIDIKGVHFDMQDFWPINSTEDPVFPLDTMSGDFGYLKAFHLIVGNLKKCKSYLPEERRIALDFSKYIYPSDKKSFNTSPLWNDLGFNTYNDFEIKMTVKDFEDFSHFTPNRYGSIIDFENEHVVHNSEYLLWNELDSLIFDKTFYSLDLLNKDVMNDLMRIYHENLGDELEVSLRRYFAPLLDKSKKIYREFEILSDKYENEIDDIDMLTFYLEQLNEDYLESPDYFDEVFLHHIVTLIRRYQDTVFLTYLIPEFDG